VSKDVFEPWRGSRFIIAPGHLVDVDDPFQYIIILTDIAYWHENWEKLQQWCEEYNSEILGMTVNIPDDKMLVLWTLRWS